MKPDTQKQIEEAALEIAGTDLMLSIKEAKQSLEEKILPDVKRYSLSKHQIDSLIYAALINAVQERTRRKKKEKVQKAEEKKEEAEEKEA